MPRPCTATANCWGRETDARPRGVETTRLFDSLGAKKPRIIFKTKLSPYKLTPGSSGRGADPRRCVQCLFRGRQLTDSGVCIVLHKEGEARKLSGMPGLGCRQVLWRVAT